MQPKISIALATYNGEKYLQELLDSLCNQSLQPNEVLVSDDCSTDNTLSIISKYSDKLNIRQVIHDKNCGVNKNFEAAIKSCSGDYVMICDQDDIWMPNKIQDTFSSMLEEENLVGPTNPILITSDSTPFSDSNNLKANNEYKRKGEIRDFKDFFFSSDLHCQGCTMMLNRPLLEIMHSIPDSFKEWPYDGYIAQLATLIGFRCHVRQEMLYYRRHDNNVFGKNHKLTNKEKKRLYLGIATFSFFHCPYIRQVRWGLMLREFDDFILEERKYYASFFSSYATASFFKKIKIVLTIKGIAFSQRIRQLFLTIFTYPLRIFLVP